MSEDESREDLEDSEDREARQSLELLLSETARGSRDAFAKLYRASHYAVYAAALSILGSAAEAEEIAHDAFLRIWQSAGRYRPGGSPMGWMIAVTRNLALMELRKRSRIAPLTDSQWDAIPADAPAVTAEDRALLQDALGALSREERQIVLLHTASGLKHRETAKVLGMPVGTVLSKYNRAIKKLRRIMEGGELNDRPGA